MNEDIVDSQQPIEVQATPEPKVRRRRARKTDGQFQGDDPSTPENEAWESTNEHTSRVAAEAASGLAQGAAQGALKEGTVSYVTKDVHTSSFDVLVAGQTIRGVWDTKRERLIFRVPAELEHRFVNYVMVLDGRIIKA